MTRSAPTLSAGSSDASDATFGKREVIALVARFIAGFAIILVLALGLGHFARAECELVARRFVADYGYWGMALGTLLADGFHFPIPPQFYMLLAVASGASAPRCLAAIALASLLAGYVGYRTASLAVRIRWLVARTERTRRLLQRAYQRFGVRAALLASLLPVPYSVLCYLAGLSRLPRGFLVVLCLCRIPKLVGFYVIVHLGWHPS